MNLSTYTKEFSYNLKLAYPIILGMLGHTVVGIVDNIMVGKLGPDELAAVSLGNSFVFIAMSSGKSVLSPKINFGLIMVIMRFDLLISWSNN